MQEFSIKAVERLSGIKAHTIRIWEQRYGIVAPSRKESNHRVYTNEELRLLLKIAYLYNTGLKISSISAMSLGEIDQVVEQSNPLELNPTLSLLEMIKPVLDLDATKFEDQIDALIKKHGFEDAMLKVLFPLLNRLGVLWLTEKILPGQEHFASNIITNKILKTIDQFKPNGIEREGNVMMFAPEGEFHEIAMLYFRFQLLQQGCKVIYLGCNTSLEVIKAFYDVLKPTHLLVNMVSNLQEPTPVILAETLINMFPKACLVMSGMAVRNLDLQLEGLRILKTEEAMLEFASNIFGHS